VRCRYAENGSLGQTLKAFGKLNEKLVASYVFKILEGLDYLHRSDVVHCDLKAANILTTKTGNVKLSDFGVSLNRLARQDKIPPTIGREMEIQQIIEILCHRERANSPMLVGEPGVGKTAVVEGLARLIENYMHAVVVFAEGAEQMQNLEVPYLSEMDRARARDDLKRAKIAVEGAIKRLNGGV